MEPIILCSPCVEMDKLVTGARMVEGKCSFVERELLNTMVVTHIRYRPLWCHEQRVNIIRTQMAHNRHQWQFLTTVRGITPPPPKISPLPLPSTITLWITLLLCLVWPITEYCGGSENFHATFQKHPESWRKNPTHRGEDWGRLHQEYCCRWGAQEMLVTSRISFLEVILPEVVDINIKSNSAYGFLIKY